MQVRRVADGKLRTLLKTVSIRLEEATHPDLARSC